MISDACIGLIIDAFCSIVWYTKAAGSAVMTAGFSAAKRRANELFVALQRPGGQMKAWDFSVG
jgi:hypothetical protein